MKVIYKYPFNITAEIKIDIPRGFKVVHVGLDPNMTPCIWAEIDCEKLPETYSFTVRGTGHKYTPCDRGEAHIGTFLAAGGVWHVFQVDIREVL